MRKVVMRDEDYYQQDEPKVEESNRVEH
jgi:hypothetical protein